MKRILFVDDEPLILEALERSLYCMHREWEMRFANSGTEALEIMPQWTADVVVSDMRMPQMNGAQLLNEIMRRHPKTVRIILSGFSDMEMVMQCIGGTHQFLSKPCSGEVLRNVIGRALELDAWVNNEELDAPKGGLDQVSAKIAQDPGMTAKMLQLVNSAFFGLRRQLSNPTEAVLQLGLDTIKSLVLGIHVFSDVEFSGDAGISLQELWHHSLATATIARRIAQWERQDQKLVEESFTAGLLHDVGRLVLAVNLPEQYAQARLRSKSELLPLVDAERATFGASHADVGGYLLGLWGLPVSLIEAAMFHHRPGLCKTRSFTPLSIVHVANVLEQSSVSGPEVALLPQLDDNYLCQIGMFDRAQIWRRLLGPGVAAK